jgi:hypothetical protein
VLISCFRAIHGDKNQQQWRRKERGKTRRDKKIRSTIQKLDHLACRCLAPFTHEDPQATLTTVMRAFMKEGKEKRSGSSSKERASVRLPDGKESGKKKQRRKHFHLGGAYVFRVVAILFFLLLLAKCTGNQFTHMIVRQKVGVKLRTGPTTPSYSLFFFFTCHRIEATSCRYISDHTNRRQKKGGDIETPLRSSNASLRDLFFSPFSPAF